MAPLGQPLFSAFAGFIPSSAHGVSIDTDSLFYQAAIAYRVAPALGVDATILGTQHKAILERPHLPQQAGPVSRRRPISSSADYGVILTAATVGGGPVSLSFDLRKVKSQDGRPLLPVTGSNGSFNGEPNVRGWGPRQLHPGALDPRHPVGGGDHQAERPLSKERVAKSELRRRRVARLRCSPIDALGSQAAGGRPQDRPRFRILRWRPLPGEPRSAGIRARAASVTKPIVRATGNEWSARPS